MSQSLNGIIKSFKAAGTLSAYYPVYVSAANTVALAATTTVIPAGITIESASAANKAVAVCLNGTAKCVCSASVTVGKPVKAASGGIAEATLLATTTTLGVPILGVALESGSTNSVIEVALNIVVPAS